MTAPLAAGPLPAQCPFDPHVPLPLEEVLATYAEMRRAGVSYSDRYGGFWILSRFVDVRAALRDPTTFSSADGIRVPVIGEGRALPIEYDPPVHTEYRAMFSRRITSKTVQDMLPFLEALVARLVDSFVAAGGGDFVERVALPMPLAVLTEVVGFSEDTVAQLRHLTEESWRRIGSSSVDDARQGLRRAVQDEVARHRRERPDDYLTELLDTQIQGRPISDDELERALVAFAIAGHETTTNAAGWMAHLLSQDPELQDRVRADEASVPVYVEEALRLATPVQLLARVTTRDVVVDGHKIPAGARVLLSYAAANRDEAQYAHADEMDITRGSRGHLTFGFGIHQCPGAPLARAELRLLLRRLITAPPMRSGGPADFPGLVGGIHLGPRALPIRFDTERKRDLR